MLNDIISGLIQTFIVWLITSAFKWFRKSIAGIRPAPTETSESLRSYFLTNLICGLFLLVSGIIFPADWPVMIRIILMFLAAICLSSCWISFEAALEFDPRADPGENIPSQGATNRSSPK